MKRWLAPAIGVVVVVAVVAYAVLPGRRPRAGEPLAPPAPGVSTSMHPPLPPGAVATDTAHYRIQSTATAGQTAQIGRAVESLHDSYAGCSRTCVAIRD